MSYKKNILLVEDEDAVRLFATRALQDKGYTVTQAREGQEALKEIEKALEKGISFDLVITDVVMPTMDGPTFVRQVQKKYADIQVIFISGYAEDAFRQKIKGDRDIHFLSKPFTLKQLAEKVKEALSPSHV